MEIHQTFLFVCLFMNGRKRYGFSFLFYFTALASMKLVDRATKSCIGERLEMK